MMPEPPGADSRMEARCQGVRCVPGGGTSWAPGS